MPHITHIVPALFGSDGVFGGAERYALELAKACSRVYPTALLTFGEESRTLLNEKLTIHVLKPTSYIKNQKNNPFSFGLTSFLQDTDVIHCHQQHIVLSTFSAILGKFLGKKVVVSDLGGGGFDLSAFINTDSLYDAHLHISDYSKRVFGHAARKDADVIYGGVDIHKFAPLKTHVHHPSKRVVFVGRLLPHKGILQLIQSLPPYLGLDIIGRPLDDHYFSLLKTERKQKDIHFFTDYNDEQTIEAMQQSLCVVLPSLYQHTRGAVSRVPELLGQTLLEGMACGVPVICTHVASMPEIVLHNHTGFVVPPNDLTALTKAIIQLSEDESLWLKLAQQARNHVVNTFCWEHVVERCKPYYAI
jgi:glycosyltransferase involved in cell wall biosynthesis